MEKNNNEALSKLEKIIFQDPGHRGISKLWTPGCLYEAASRILASSKDKESYVLTGFCALYKTCETDGPIGASVLANILRKIGFNISILCDTFSFKVVEASSLGCKLTVTNDPNELLQSNISFIISIERPGRSEKTNDYRTMKCKDISDVTAPLDLLFPNNQDGEKRNYLTVSIGDGGNEVGTGNIIDRVKSDVKNGEDICTISTCDVLIMAGVSNWGGIALAAAIVILLGDKEIAESFISLMGQQEHMLNLMIRHGAYDGVSGKLSMAVDGFEFEKEHKEINNQIIEVVKKRFSI